jgi:hypothetical protein
MRVLLRAVLAVLAPASAFAGPPYVTDDPEPVAHRHWELYLASQASHDADGWSATLPHVEVNYGVIPDVQLHLIAPLAYVRPDGGEAAYGYGDTELGVKVRFVHEGPWLPQIGTFPMLEIPTGSQRRGLGNGTAQVFVPLWAQKSFGPWTTYGGAGLWIDAGRSERRFWQFGWQVQRTVVDGLTIGAEIFHTTPDVPGAEHDTRFNVGAVVDITEEHHLLFSAGRSVVGTVLLQSYVAYQWTVGPEEN